jgi:hypothetical protein
VTLFLRDGQARQSHLTLDGELPDVLLQDAELVREALVVLPSSPILREMSVIDTPGLSSGRGEVSRRTMEALFDPNGPEGLSRADALLFVLRGTEDEVEVLSSFQALTQGMDACAANVIGVLSQADRVGSLPDPLASLIPTLHRLATEPALRFRLATIVPVIGLLAEAGGASMIRQQDAAALRQLADQDDDLDDILADGREFIASPGPVSEDQRRRLLDMLGLYGIRVAMEGIRSGHGSPDALNELLLKNSGFPRLRELIRELFGQRADTLKADQALAMLERLSYQTSTAAGQQIRAHIEQLRFQPAMHAILETWALAQRAKDEVELPEWLEEDLLRVTLSTDPASKLGCSSTESRANLLQAAITGAARAHAYAVGGRASTLQARVAEVVRTSFTLTYQDIAGDQPSRG